MSHLNSWEDDPAAQDENLARQAQQLNMNPQGQPQQAGFRANAAAASFQPTANAFQPGQFGGYQQQYQQYYQQGYYPQYGGQQAGFDQYAQGQSYQQAGYGQNYGAFALSPAS